ncbi:MAG: porin [Nitrospirota bacterium]
MKRIWVISVLAITLVSQAYADVETKVGGLIEVGYEKIGKGKGVMSAEDIEVAIEVKLNDKVSGNVLLRPDAEAENDGDILDEVGITLQNFSQVPLSLYVGKAVMPFGVFNSHLISDPWTKENNVICWEINQVGLIGSYNKERANFSLAIYDSSADEEPSAIATQVSLSPIEGVTIGAGYRSQKGDKTGTNTLSDVSAMTEYRKGPVTIDIEYCEATKREKDEPKPSAYSVGLAGKIKEPLEIALRYDGFKDDDKNAISSKSRIGIGVNYTLLEETTLSLEYGKTKLEEGDNQSSYLAKLAIEF